MFEIAKSVAVCYNQTKIYAEYLEAIKITRKINTRVLVISAALTAAGYVLPTFMPTVHVGVWTLTPLSHVPLTLAMFISPVSAAFVTIATAFAFFFKVPDLLVFMRACSHFVFAVPFSMLIMRNIGTKRASIIVFAVLANLVHAAAELVAVIAGVKLFGLSGDIGLRSLLLLIMLGTLLHGLFDYFVALVLYRAAYPANLVDRRFVFIKKKPAQKGDRN